MASTVCLGLNCALDQIFIVASNDGLYRTAIDGWGLDHAHGTRSRHGEIEGAWNRCGAESEDIDVGAQLLDTFLLLHPKALLLVDNKQAEVLKVDVLTE